MNDLMSKMKYIKYKYKNFLEHVYPKVRMKMSWWSYVLMLLVYLLYLFVGAGMLQNINLTIAQAFYFIRTTQKLFKKT